MIELTTELYNKIYSQWAAEGSLPDFGHYLCEEFKRIQDIHSKYRQTLFRYEEIEKQYHNEKLKISAKQKDIQNTCHHEVTEYYPDSSGNNDSCTVCKICGAEL